MPINVSEGLLKVYGTSLLTSIQEEFLAIRKVLGRFEHALRVLAIDDVTTVLDHHCYVTAAVYAAIFSSWDTAGSSYRRRRVVSAVSPSVRDQLLPVLISSSLLVQIIVYFLDLPSVSCFIQQSREISAVLQKSN